MAESKYSVVLSSAPSEAVAATLARGLVDGRLAACVHVLPAGRSFYRWHGALQEDEEHTLVAKTTTSRLSALIDWLAAAHPYDCPEIIALPIEGGAPAYLDWIGSSLEE